ncbi:MAG: hypothetical protein IAE99_05775 [Rhodothermales bacterium]|nr:hypothetical protein [Rhodothermales bacterium]
MPLSFRLVLALGLGFVASGVMAGWLAGMLGVTALGSERMIVLWIVSSGVLLMVLPRSRRAAPSAPDVQPVPSPDDPEHVSEKPPHPRTLREMQRRYQRLYEQERERQHRRS